MRESDGATSRLRVLIAPATELARSWFAGFPRETDAFSIVGVVPFDDDLPAQIHELAPDVVVLDAPNPEVEGIAHLVERVTDPGIDIVVVRDGEAAGADHTEFVQAGVRAILSHHPTVEELGAVIHAVAAGFLVLDPSFLDAIARNGSSAVPAMTTTAAPAAPLTPREIDVLNGLAEGLGNKQIAVRLGISEHTVKTHLAAIFEKLDAANRTEAVMAGARLGLVLL